MTYFVNEMIAKNKVVGKYGVKFLDDYLLGIKKSDFIMIGAPTGTGKSNLAYNIAFDNAVNLNVHLFALEADHNEPFVRRLYSEYSKALKALDNRYANFREFTKGNFENPILLKGIEKDIVEKYHKLAVHYKDKEFNMNTLLDRLTMIADKDKCDMIIIDHVDYFDILSDASENLQVSEIMKFLRDINLEWGIPVILISHLRKKTNRKIKIPEIEDIFGTSNKQKQMKTVILLAPDYANSKHDRGIFGTFFTIPKDRQFGGTHLIGQCTFDNAIGQYLPEYNLAISEDFGESIKNYEGGIPAWATLGR